MTRPKTTAPSAKSRPRRPRRPAGAAAREADDRRSLREELDALERSRAELCSALSHDLRNPLSVVVWSAQLLSRRITPEDAARRHLDAIARAAEEMNQILHDLSDAARIPDGRLAAALALEHGEIGPLVDQAAAPSRPQAAGKELALTLDAGPEVGSLSCDRERITRVIGGLIATAVRRTPRGGSVTVRAERGPSAAGGEEVRVTVEDGGPEIPEADRASLFELPLAPPPGEVRRAKPVSHAVSLFVARGVAEAHGGRMALEGAPGGGARFVLTLPAE